MWEGWVGVGCCGRVRGAGECGVWGVVREEGGEWGGVGRAKARKAIARGGWGVAQ